MTPTLAPTPRTTFSSLRHRNFRLFFIGQSISNSGNWLTNVALTLLVLRLTATGVGVGLLAACQFGPMLLFSAWGGAVADRSDKRRLLLVTQSLEMGQSIALAVLAFMPHPPLVALYAFALVGGVLLSLDDPLRRSFVSEMVLVEDLPNAVVLYSTIVNLSRIFGPSLAGLLVVTTGYGWCFTIDSSGGLQTRRVLACSWSLAESPVLAPRRSGRSWPSGCEAVHSAGTVVTSMCRRGVWEREARLQRQGDPRRSRYGQVRNDSPASREHR